IIGTAGAYVAAMVSGALVLFAPAGLGAREGVLVLILRFYFPISIAILLSFLARIWVSLTELILLFSIYLYSKFCKIYEVNY
ncbi:hypothetical protein ACFLZ0_03220, partial [Patescibacteria group bacterium]